MKVEDIDPCDDCGQRHVGKTPSGGIYKSCTGHRRKVRPLKPCGRVPSEPLTVCRVHGAGSPQSLDKIDRVRSEREAEKIMRKFGGPIDTNATDALLDTVRWTAGYVAFCRDQVAQLDADATVWGVTKETEGHVVVGNGPDAYVDTVTDTVREAKPNVWVELLRAWQDQLIKVCAETIKAGIEERKVRLAEQQGALVAQAMKQIFGDPELALTPEQMAKSGAVAARHLRLLIGGSAA